MKKILISLGIAITAAQAMQPKHKKLILIAETTELAIYKTADGLHTYVADKIWFGTYKTIDNCREYHHPLNDFESTQNLIDQNNQRTISHHIRGRSE